MLRAQNVGLFLLASILFVGVAVAEDHPAQQLVANTTSELLAAFQTEKEAIEADSAVLRSIVGDKILPHFDFVRMSKLALGKYWRRATVSQRKAFAVQFRELLVNTYAKALYRFADAEVSYKPARFKEGDKYIDVTSLVSVGDEPVEVTYRLHQKKGAWKVFNITIEGVSLITNYRSTFSSFVSRKGIDALVADLERKNKLVVDEDDDGSA
ncbi:MAG: ABC transporter substrate-binding protein [Gammaproteobacteria bacterium]|nr:ABC transporter substrate-binding protein [Gammaproteobacteria bacterium]